MEVSHTRLPSVLLRSLTFESGEYVRSDCGDQDESPPLSVLVLERGPARPSAARAPRRVPKYKSPLSRRRERRRSGPFVVCAYTARLI